MIDDTIKQIEALPRFAQMYFAHDRLPTYPIFDCGHDNAGFDTDDLKALAASYRRLEAAVKHYADLDNWEKNDDVDPIYARVWKIKHGFHFAREALEGQDES